MCFLANIVDHIIVYAHIHTHTHTHMYARAIDRSAAMIEKAMRGKLVVKDFRSFEGQIKEIYEECKSKEGGEVINVPTNSFWHMCSTNCL